MAIIETKPAAYKGIALIAIGATTNGGMKDALFEYPNSNRQTIEQFGRKVRSHELTVVVPHEDYFDNLNRILNVLDEGGAGPLDHPTFGRLENMKVRTFVLTERISDLGRAEIRIVFGIDDDIGTPQKAVNSVSEVNQSNVVLTEELNTEITEDFEVDTEFAGNFQDAQGLLADIGDAFDSIVETVTAITDEIDEFSARINSFQDDINQLISLPDQLADSVDGLFSSVSGITSSFESAVDAYADLFGFGDDDTPIIETTAGLIQRAKNRDVMNQVMQTSSLGYAYLNAVQIEFQTTEDIDNANAQLEAQYEKIISNDKFSEEAKRAITDTRTIANQLFDEARIDAKKTIEVYTHRRPMSEIAYQYYGSTELTDTLLELNNISNSAFVEGTIKILTE